MKNEISATINITFIIVTVLVLLGALPLLQTGINVYNDQLMICKEFKKVEKNFAEKNFDSIEHGFINRYIFSFMAQPAPTLVLFYNSVPFNSLQATIDNSGVILKNYSYIGSYNFKRSSYLNIDFVSYLIIVSVFLIPMYVFLCHRDEKTSIARFNFQTVLSKYWKSTLAKVIYMVASMTILLGIVFAMYIFNGIKLNRSEVLKIIAYFFFAMIFQLLILASATLANVLKRRVLWSIVIILVWSSSIFLLGCVFPSVSNDSIDPFLSEKLAFKKNNTFENFQNSASKILRETKKTDREKIDKEILKKSIMNLRGLRDSENLLIEELKKALKRNCLSRLSNPFIYMLGCNGDIGSLGFRAYLDYYKEVNERQYKISEQYLKKVLGKQPGKTMPIFNPIIKIKSKLPHYFFQALILYIILLILFLFLVYFPFKRSILLRVKKSFRNIKLTVKKGEYILLHVSAGIEDFINKLVNIIFNKGEKFDGDITVDGQPLAAKKVFFLPELSGEDIKQLAMLSGGVLPGKSLKELNFQELCRLFPQIRHCDVLLLNNTSIELEPQDNLAIIKITSGYPDKDNTKFCDININENGYFIKREIQNS